MKDIGKKKKNPPMILFKEQENLEFLVLVMD